MGKLDFTNGSIQMTGIALPPPRAHLIRGDVDCNGKVDVLDLRTVAAYFDKGSTDPEWPAISKYDVKMDNTIDIFSLSALPQTSDIHLHRELTIRLLFCKSSRFRKKALDS